MNEFGELLNPQSVAIVGLSADPSKHGSRVMGNLRRLGFEGRIWGVNPRGGEFDDVDVFPRLSDVPEPVEVVVCAVPAPIVPSIVREAADVGSGTVIVFAGGFAEAGPEGRSLQDSVTAVTRERGVRVLGPNSGGVIVPSNGVALSFLTCLDRPVTEIRSGPVGLVTQSGGTGSYLHNLAAARGGGLAASISTGNEVDLDVADGIELLANLDEVRAVAVVLETVRNGDRFVEAVRLAQSAQKPVVAAMIGRSDRGGRLMRTHTAALAHPARVLDGVLASLGVAVAETPQEMLEVAEILARSARPPGARVGIVTHSGGIAIMLSDLAERARIDLPAPSRELQATLEPLLEQGAIANPLDMGGIIGGAHRYGEVVRTVASSGEFDVVLAVSTAHPRAHTEDRVAALLALDIGVPVVHLWMAGDVGAAGLAGLTAAGAPVTEEPRAAIRAIAALTSPPALPALGSLTPVPTPPGPLSEFEAKRLVRSWGIEVVDGAVAATPPEAISVAERLGFPLVVKVDAPGLTHKTEIGGVVVGLETPAAVEAAASEVLEAAQRAGLRYPARGVLVERYTPGPEVIVGATRDETFGAMVLVGIGGVVAEALDDVRLALAPVSPSHARRMITSLAGLRLLTHPRSGGPADLDALADLVVALGERITAQPEIDAVDLNPVAWTGNGWQVLDAAIELVH